MIISWIRENFISQKLLNFLSEESFISIKIITVVYYSEIGLWNIKNLKNKMVSWL